LALEGSSSGQHLIQHGTEGEDIARCIDRLPLGLLRRHIGHRAHDHAGRRHHLRQGQRRDIFAAHRGRWRDKFGQPKIQYFDQSALVHHDVGRFQVAVNYACGMRARESLGGLHGVLYGQIRCQTTWGNQLRQGLPRDVLHNHEVKAILRTDVMNNADVGMLQPRDGFRLLLEPRMQIWTGGQMSGQDFNGYRAL
jgi:hypothetical protein